MNGYIWREIVDKRQDRLIAFFDAVLAIAITVLALEMVIPAVGNTDISELKEFAVSVTCYLISFMAMAMIWYIHTKFFSMYSLTGGADEIVLHLVLMFFITFFQPATRAVGQHQDDLWVRLIYLGIFAVMMILNIVIMVVVRYNNDHNDRTKENLIDTFKENTKDSDEEIDRIIHIVYAINHPEQLIESASERLPEEYLKDARERADVIQNQIRFSIIATIELLIAIVAAVVLLTHSIIGCYIALAAGAMAVFFSRVIFYKAKNN